MSSADTTRPELGDVESAGAAPWAWYGLTVLLMTTLLALVVRQMLSLIAPSLQSSMGLTDMQLGLLQGLGLAIVACVASYPMGWLADRFGRRLILAIGILCWSVATALCAFQNTFGGVFLGTVGIAIGEAGLAPIVYAMIPDLFPERKRQAANFIFYGGSLLGAGIGIALGGALLEWLSGAHGALPAWLAGIDAWRVAMIAVAAPGPIFLLLVLTMPIGKRAVPASRETGAVQKAMAGFLPYARANWRTLGSIFGAIFAMNVAMASCLVWFPVALPRAFGIDPATVGVGLGTAITVATVGGIFLPAATLRVARSFALPLEPVHVAQLFFWIAVAPAAALPFVTSSFQAYAVAAAVGAMGVASSALMPGMLQDLAPPDLRSRVLALLGIVNALALAASPIAIGAISSLFEGPRGMLQAIAMVCVPSLVAAAVLMFLAARPFDVTVRATRAQLSGETA